MVYLCVRLQGLRVKTHRHTDIEAHTRAHTRTNIYNTRNVNTRTHLCESVETFGKIFAKKHYVWLDETAARTPWDPADECRCVCKF